MLATLLSKHNMHAKQYKDFWLLHCFFEKYFLLVTCHNCIICKIVFSIHMLVQTSRFFSETVTRACWLAKTSKATGPLDNLGEEGKFFLFSVKNFINRYPFKLYYTAQRITWIASISIIFTNLQVNTVTYTSDWSQR